jgi:hypothetical protein
MSAQYRFAFLAANPVFLCSIFSPNVILRLLKLGTLRKYGLGKIPPRNGRQLLGGRFT